MHMKGEPMVGKEKWAKEKELCLSDAYIVKDNEPSLELKVKVINIRPEEHHEILEKCQVLKEYSQFMEIVQNYQISGVEEPYKKAIKECIEKGILADYLMRKISKWRTLLEALAVSYGFNPEGGTKNYSFSTYDSHFPILLGIPDAQILSFDGGAVHECAYEDTESYKVTEMFINNRHILLNKLLSE